MLVRVDIVRVVSGIIHSTMLLCCLVSVAVMLVLAHVGTVIVALHGTAAAVHLVTDWA